MKAAIFGVWVVIFFALYWIFIVLFQFGPRSFPAGSSHQWAEIRSLFGGGEKSAPLPSRPKPAEVAVPPSTPPPPKPTPAPETTNTTSQPAAPPATVPQPAPSAPPSPPPKTP